MLLSMSKGGKRKDSVWGSGGGQQPVNHLVKEVLTESNREATEQVLDGALVGKNSMWSYVGK